MNILGLPIFVSLMLVVGALVLFIFSVNQRDYEHDDRLALSPLDDDDASPLEHIDTERTEDAHQNH